MKGGYYKVVTECLLLKWTTSYFRKNCNITKLTHKISVQLLKIQNFVYSDQFSHISTNEPEVNIDISDYC